MAYPQVQSVTETIVSFDFLNHNITMPATVNAGDLLLCLFSHDSAAGTETVTTPSGWTQKGYGNDARSGFGVYAKSASGSEDGTTVNFVTSAAQKASAQVYRITGWRGDVATDIEVAIVSGVGEFPNPPNLDPSNWATEETLWIAAFSCSTDMTTVSVYPTNYGNGVVTGEGGDFSTAQVVSARREYLSSSDNPGTFTMNPTSAKNWIAFTIAIRPTTSIQNLYAPILGDLVTLYAPGVAIRGDLFAPLLDNTVTVNVPGFYYPFDQDISIDEILSLSNVFYDSIIRHAAYPLDAVFLGSTLVIHEPTIIPDQFAIVPHYANAPVLYAPNISGPRNIVSPFFTTTTIFYDSEIFSVWEGTDSYTNGVWIDAN